MKKFWFFCSISASLVASEETALAKRVHAHLLIEDVQTARQEAESALKRFPDSQILTLALLQALCQSGNEIEAFEKWNESACKHEQLLSDRTALETLAWAVIKKGTKSQQQLIKLFSLVGAAITRDASAIVLLQSALTSSSVPLRSVAVMLSAEYGDLPLRQELARLLKEEKVWTVRLEVIKAIGKLQMREQKPLLKEIIAHRKTLVQEKAAAIVALVGMYEGIEKEEWQALTHSNRAGLRELSCQIAQHLDLKEELKDLEPLLSDPSPNVRLSAINTFVLLDVALPEDKWEKLCKDHAPEVAITAAYAALVQGHPIGKQLLKEWLLDSDRNWQRLSSAAIGAAGERGADLAEEILTLPAFAHLRQDPYVTTNLALGLIGQRRCSEKACAFLERALKQSQEQLWMWDSSINPLFRTLSPSLVSHTPETPNYPSVVDQLTRLEILSVLCILQYHQALSAMKEFLQSHSWGVTGSAAMTLVTEGDEESIALIRQLLKDPEEKVRIQAALLLALMGSDPEALKTLQEAYPKVEREMKIRILEALANSGDMTTIPFLLSILNEPFQALRVIAASAIIQCLSK